MVAARTIAILFAGAACAIGAPSADVPLGHGDFRPTPARPVGWLGDGSGVFGGYSGPTTWNAQTGANVLWKTRLPNWCNGSPIVVGDGAGGGRVFLMAEPVDYAPLLLCIDARTGRELWRREIDAVDSLPAAQQAEARRLAREGWQWRRQFVTLSTEISDLGNRCADQFSEGEPNASIKPQWDALMERARQLGAAFCGFRQSAGGYAHVLEPITNGSSDQRNRRLRELGLMWSRWFYQGTWDGVAFPTPVSDGQAVYVVTAHNVYAAYDMDGKRLWQHRFAPPRLADLSPEQKASVTQGDARSRWPHGWPGQGHFSTSPVLADGVLISNAGAYLRGLDAATGKTLWEHANAHEIGQNMGNPRLIALGGQRFVIAVSGQIVRVSDGRVCGQLPGTVCAKMEIDAAVIAGDIVVLIDGDWRDRDLVGVRLTRQGDAVRAAELWRVSKRDRRAFSTWRTVVRDGLCYAGGAVLEAQSGAMVKERLEAARGGYCWHANMILGNAFVSLAHDKGRFLFRNLNTGKTVGDSMLPVNPPDGAPQTQKRAEAHGPSWGVLGAAAPFAQGNRLYIRTFDHLWCIGPAPGP
jgi:outer membrane protein assembly factor BamB